MNDGRLKPGEVGFFTDGGEADLEPDSDENESAEQVLEKIDGLIGCDGFKALAAELAGIAPQVLRHKTQKTFLFQNYLFSISEGSGLKGCLELFASLIEALGLFRFSADNKIFEAELEPPGGDSSTSFSHIIAALSSYGSGGKLVCLDISEWMSATNRADFKRFLLAVNELEEKHVFIFRVPMIEGDVLNGLHNSLNDILFIRDVVFEPLDANELLTCAKREVASLGYSVLPQAWSVFRKRIVQEKSDGRFYGESTVKKVVNEMVYLKQLTNAKVNSFDTEIKKRDILALARGITDNGQLNGLEALDRLCGMEDVKRQILEIVSQIEFSLKSGTVDSPCIHMRFVGNPGTGKTTVARIVGKILKEKGVLRNGDFFEYSGRDFCGMYVGHTAPKTAAMCRDAYGSVLFIDEAYTLCADSKGTADFGQEALATLVAEMENHRSDLVVIMAGYSDDMERLMSANAGLASRMPYTIRFNNYSRETLVDIFMSMVKGGFEFDSELEAAVNRYFMSLPNAVVNSKEFSNARFVRNLFERTWGKASMRAGLEKSKRITVMARDFDLAAASIDTHALNAKSAIGFTAYE